MPDERRESTLVAGGADHCVGLDSSAVRERHAFGVQRLDTTDDLDLAALDRLDHFPVDNGWRDAEARAPRKHALAGDGEPIFAEVAEVHPSSEPRDGVGEPNRQVVQRRCHNVAGKPSRALPDHERPRHDAPTWSARSINVGVMPRSFSATATETPAGPAPTTATCCLDTSQAASAVRRVIGPASGRCPVNCQPVRSSHAAASSTL